MFDFIKLKKTVAELGSAIKKHRAQIEGLKQRRELLEVQPMPRSELADLVCDWVDQEAAVFPQRLRMGVDALIRNPMLEITGRPCHLLQSTGGSYQTDKIPPENLLYLMSDQIKARLRDAVAEMDYPEDVGPPRAERPGMMKKLDDEIAKLENSEGQLLEQARAAGVLL